MPPRTRSALPVMAPVALLCSALTLSGCGTVSTLFQDHVGSLLGEVDGARKVRPIAVGAEALTATANALAKAGDNSEQQPVDAEVVSAVRDLNPDSHFAATLVYDGCSQSDPRLVKDGTGLRAELTTSGKVCESAEPRTAVFQVGWSEVPNQFWFGADANDPARVRVDGRTVSQPRQWQAVSLKRRELPNSPQLTFAVAQKSKDKSALLEGDDVKLKAKYSDSDIVIVTWFGDCPTSPELVLVGKKLVFYSPKLEPTSTACGTNTVEIAAFVIPKKSLPKKFSLGAGEQPADTDETVTLS